MYAAEFSFAEVYIMRFRCRFKIYDILGKTKTDSAVIAILFWNIMPWTVSIVINQIQYLHIHSLFNMRLQLLEEAQRKHTKVRISVLSCFILCSLNYRSRRSQVGMKTCNGIQIHREACYPDLKIWIRMCNTEAQMLVYKFRNRKDVHQTQKYLVFASKLGRQHTTKKEKNQIDGKVQPTHICYLVSRNQSSLR